MPVFDLDIASKYNAIPAAHDPERQVRTFMSEKKILGIEAGPLDRLLPEGHRPFGDLVGLERAALINVHGGVVHPIARRPGPGIDDPEVDCPQLWVIGKRRLDSTERLVIDSEDVVVETNDQVARGLTQADISRPDSNVLSGLEVAAAPELLHRFSGAVLRMVVDDDDLDSIRQVLQRLQELSEYVLPLVRQDGDGDRVGVGQSVHLGPSDRFVVTGEAPHAQGSWVG